MSRETFGGVRPEAPKLSVGLDKEAEAMMRKRETQRPAVGDDLDEGIELVEELDDSDIIGYSESGEVTLKSTAKNNEVPPAVPLSALPPEKLKAEVAQLTVDELKQKMSEHTRLVKKEVGRVLYENTRKNLKEVGPFQRVVEAINTELAKRGSRAEREETDRSTVRKIRETIRKSGSAGSEIDHINKQLSRYKSVAKTDEADLGNTGIKSVRDSKGVFAKARDILVVAKNKVTGFFKGLFGKKPVWEQPEFQPDTSVAAPPPLQKEATNLGRKPWQHESVQAGPAAGNADANTRMVDSLLAQGGRVDVGDILDVQSRMRGGDPDSKGTSSIPDMPLEDALAAADKPVGGESLREMQRNDRLFVNTVRDLLSSNYIAPKAGVRELRSVPVSDRGAPSVIDLVTFLNANPERTVNTIDELEELGRFNPTLNRALSLLSDRITGEIGDRAEGLVDEEETMVNQKDVRAEIKLTIPEILNNLSGVDRNHAKVILQHIAKSESASLSRVQRIAQMSLGEDFDQAKFDAAWKAVKKSIDQRFTKKGRPDVAEMAKAA